MRSLTFLSQSILHGLLILLISLVVFFFLLFFLNSHVGLRFTSLVGLKYKEKLHFVLL